MVYSVYCEFPKDPGVHTF